jgi:TatD family-associated radical SAM protein
MDVSIYKLGKDTYINLTNRCTNHCGFCIRENKEGVGGYNLWLDEEPTAKQVIDGLSREKPDVVFCGYGEPMIRLDELLEIARYVKSYGGRVRVNTNGHASAFHKRDVAPELAGLIDEVSVSLNGADAANYAKITKSRYGEAGYGYMLDFARRCVEEGVKVTMSVVDVIGGDEIEACRKIAEGIGAEFRIRHFVD